MGGELKEKVAQGVAWSMAEKIGSMLLAMAVRLIILRLLTRDILGFMSIPSAVVTVLLVIVDSGFSQSLVRHKGPSQSDYKSVFLFNIAVSAVLYGVLVALAPLAARWYGMPEIARIAPVFFLLLPLNALCAVQNTIFIRQFRFALLSKVTFLSSLAGGLTAIALAMAGWGIWSLVAERVIAVGMRTALLWWLSDWRPCGKCGLKPLREMAPFGCSLMVTDLISNFYNKIPQFFLGKLYSPAVLGSFDQAVKLKDMPAATGIQRHVPGLGEDPRRRPEVRRGLPAGGDGRLLRDVSDHAGHVGRGPRHVRRAAGRGVDADGSLFRGGMSGRTVLADRFDGLQCVESKV